jgi:hypothetical protein
VELTDIKRCASRVRVAFVIGLALTALAVGLVLSGTPTVVAGTNGVQLDARLGRTAQAIGVCQSDESLPRDTSAIRLSLEAPVGPKVTLEAFSGARLLTSGTRGAGWTGGSVTVPVMPLRSRASQVTLCIAAARPRGYLSIFGGHSSPALAARPIEGGELAGRVRSEYLRPGRSSWWSLGVSVARRMGLGRSVSGTGIALLVLLLMLGLTALVSWLLLREALRDSRPDGKRARVGTGMQRIARGMPAAAWVCATVACVNAACWSLITPPLEVPDEPSHFAYVQVLAESGNLPVPNRPTNSPALQTTLEDLHWGEIRFVPQTRSLTSEAQQRKLERDQAADLSNKGPGAAGAATTEPPLYYALETIPYELASGGTLLDRLELMRLLSALMAAVTALFGYLFIREALPGARWAWTVGGLAIALFPLLGFISGGVNPDAMLFAVSAALYYLLARAFRRGPTPRLTVTIGALTATGLLTKLNFIGFAPGVIAGLVFVCVRSLRQSTGHGQPATRISYRWLAIAILIALSPVLLYGLANIVSGRPTLGAASGALNNLGGSWFHRLCYIWEFYLPRLPGMPSYFPGISTWRQLWFDGLVGLYGWADTLFPSWVYDLALIPATAIVALAARELIRGRTVLRKRAPELCVYALTAVGVMALVGAQSYTSDVVQGFEPFWEPRYLLPMLALWGCVVALAARGAGRRWGPAVGALLVILLLAHDVVSQLQVVARYYG